MNPKLILTTLGTVVVLFVLSMNAERQQTVNAAPACGNDCTIPEEAPTCDGDCATCPDVSCPEHPDYATATDDCNTCATRRPLLKASGAAIKAPLKAVKGVGKVAKAPLKVAKGVGRVATAPIRFIRNRHPVRRALGRVFCRRRR